MSPRNTPVGLCRELSGGAARPWRHAGAERDDWTRPGPTPQGVTMNATPCGPTAHEAAVSRLVDSYRAIPEGSPVRLAKRTSNLFRPRAEATGPGLTTD